MITSRGAVLSVLAGLAAVAPTPADAGCACGAWEDLPVTLNVCLAEEGDDCDSPLTDAGRAAVQAWRALVDVWREQPQPVNFAAPQDGTHTVGLRSAASLAQTFGADVAPWVLGVTFAPSVFGLADGNAACPLPDGLQCPRYGEGPGEDVDVILVADRDFTTDGFEAWSSHVAGNVAPVWDARQVLQHELGHALGLRHESRVAALMNPFHLEFPGVVMLADDALSAREHLPTVETNAVDLAIVGFTREDGSLWGAFARGASGSDDDAPLRPGVDHLEVSDFTLTNRGAQPVRGVVTEVRLGDSLAGTLVCDLAAYGDCPLFDIASFVVPDGPGGRLPIRLVVPPLVGEPIVDDNELLLGYVDVQASGEPQPDAGNEQQRPDAQAPGPPAPDAGQSPMPVADAGADARFATDGNKEDSPGTPDATDEASETSPDADREPTGASSVDAGLGGAAGCSTDGRPAPTAALVLATLLGALIRARRRRSARVPE